MSTTEAASQWAISAFGTTIVLLQVLDEPRRDEEDEDETDDDDEQRRLRDVVVEPLPVRVEECDPVRLRDRPDHSGEDRERAEQLHGNDPTLPPSAASRAADRPLADAGRDLRAHARVMESDPGYDG